MWCWRWNRVEVLGWLRGRGDNKCCLTIDCVPKLCCIKKLLGGVFVNINIIPDTSSLLKSAKQIFEIAEQNSLEIIIPKEVLDELDRIKDDSQHVENRNAHKVIADIAHFDIKRCHKSFNGKKNDDKIVECARNINGKVYIVSEDKTFKVKFENTLTFDEFREEFEIYHENMPNDATRVLFKHINNGDTKSALQCLQKDNIKINAYNKEGYTPLILAIKLKKFNLIEAMLQYNRIDIHKHDRTHLGMTPLAYSVQGDNIEMVKFLLKNGAKPYIANKGKNKSNTPFLMACWDNRKNAIQIMEELYCKGISLNQVDGNGYTGLIKASIKGHYRVTKWLLEKGADTKIRDFKNKSALEHAQEKNYTDIVKLLGGHNA